MERSIGRQKRGASDASEESAYNDMDANDTVADDTNTSAHQPPSSSRVLHVTCPSLLDKTFASVTEFDSCFATYRERTFQIQTG